MKQQQKQQQTERPMHIGIVLNATSYEVEATAKTKDRKGYIKAANHLAKTKGHLITAEYMDGYVILGEYRTHAAAVKALPKVKRDYLKELKSRA